MRALLAGGVMSAWREEPIAGRLCRRLWNSEALWPDRVTRWLEGGGGLAATTRHLFSQPLASPPGSDGVASDARLVDSAPELASHAAAHSGGLAIARLLLECGIEANVRSQGGRNPLLTWVRPGNLRVVNPRGASINRTIAGINAGDVPQSAAGVRRAIAKENREGGQEPSPIRLKVSCEAGAE